MLLVLVVLCVGCTLCFASYDTAPQPKALPDLAEYIIQTPPNQYEKHGYSERTAIMYNLARFKELYLESAEQIQALIGRVTELESKVQALEKPPAPVPVVPVIDPDGVPDGGMIDKEK